MRVTARHAGTRRLAGHCVMHVSMVTAAQEAEAGGSFELKSSRTAWPMQLEIVSEWK